MRGIVSAFAFICSTKREEQKFACSGLFMEIILLLQHLPLPENDKRNIENSLLEKKHFKGHQAAEFREKGALLKNCVVLEIYARSYLLHSLLNKIKVPLLGMNFYLMEVPSGSVACYVTCSHFHGIRALWYVFCAMDRCPIIYSLKKPDQAWFRGPENHNIISYRQQNEESAGAMHTGTSLATRLLASSRHQKKSCRTFCHSRHSTIPNKLLSMLH